MPLLQHRSLGHERDDPPLLFLDRHHPLEVQVREIQLQSEDIYRISLWGSEMAFVVTSLIFAVVGIIASIFTRICFNQGPSSNLLHFTLVITATVCCWLMWAIVYIAQMKPLIVPILSEVE